ncbi:MAG: DUF4266 domain-containing protein [Myxococcales bacterium]|nr:DUF4266 domain-containing protein [Myxococcales bacterium]
MRDSASVIPLCSLSVRLVGMACVLSLMVATGCVRVKAHQRERLAHPAMQGQVWVEKSAGDEHVFEVRESSRGATGSAGGGCGCN